MYGLGDDGQELHGSIEGVFDEAEEPSATSNAPGTPKAEEGKKKERDESGVIESLERRHGYRG